MGINLDNEEIAIFADYLGMGFYRVKESGEFLEADAKARELFGIPLDDTDLSRHSIESLYMFPAERKLRISQMENAGDKPINGNLSLRVNGETKFLFDQCWCDGNADGERCFAGLVTTIEDRVIFPKMFDKFPIGVYELDDENKIVRFNEEALKIFGYTEKDKDDLLGRNIADFYVNPEEMKKFGEKVQEDGRAQAVLKFKNARGEIIELECFTEHLNQFELARWGMIHDVTKRQRYYKALDKMPTGYYYIEYDENTKHKHQGRIVHCNEKFANILGYESKDDLIGKDVTVSYASKEEGEEYFKRLDEADKKGEAVLNYPFRIKRVDNGEIVHVSIDAHLIKKKGEVIGREGTIRDITKQRELEERVKDTEERLKKITADINNLIHTFLHPVLKFSGHSEVLQQLSNILYKSIRLQMPDRTDLQKLGKQLENKLETIQKGLEYISDIPESAAVLAPKFKKIINVFDYEREKAENSSILLDKAIRDAALWVLEELEQMDFFNNEKKKVKLENVITDEFVEYLQNILFSYLIRTANILFGETQIMKRGVESLRRYIGSGMEKMYARRKHNLGKILEQNIEVFKAILLQKEIEIEYEASGDLDACISEHDIDRVICNLLHNAHKYSYKERNRTVRIKARELKHEDALECTISSFGLPIKKHEIESGKIFTFGFRSELTYKTDRDGTGVGLADAKEVIEAHGGDIKITSEPTRDDGDPPKYKVPYITTVTLKLPKTNN